MKKLILSLLIASSFYINADVIYGTIGIDTGDINPGADKYDVTVYQLGFLISSGNIVFSTSAGSGTIKDLFVEDDVDFDGKNLNFGYAFSDVATGSFVLGASYSSGEIENPGLPSFKASESDPYIGYSKLSGEGIDYEVLVSSGFFDAKAIIPLGNSENFRALIGYGSSDADDIDALTFGFVYKFNF